MPEEQGNPYGQLIAKAWSDEVFKAMLLADPKAAMKEVGMDAPEGVEIEVVESTQEKAYLVIPPKPGPGELSDEDLAQIAEGAAPFGPRFIDRDLCRHSHGSWGVPRPAIGGIGDPL